MSLVMLLARDTMPPSLIFTSLSCSKCSNFIRSAALSGETEPQVMSQGALVPPSHTAVTADSNLVAAAQTRTMSGKPTRLVFVCAAGRKLTTESSVSCSSAGVFGLIFLLRLPKCRRPAGLLLRRRQTDGSLALIMSPSAD